MSKNVYTDVNLHGNQIDGVRLGDWPVTGADQPVMDGGLKYDGTDLKYHDGTDWVRLWGDKTFDVSQATYKMSYNTTSQNITLDFEMSKIPSVSNDMKYIFASFMSLGTAVRAHNNKYDYVSFQDSGATPVVLPLRRKLTGSASPVEIRLSDLPEFTSGEYGTLVFLYDSAASCLWYLGAMPQYHVGATVDSDAFLRKDGAFVTPPKPAYGTCNTAAATVNKTVTTDYFMLEAGSVIAVRFTNTNTAANPKLVLTASMQSLTTDPIPIVYDGVTVASTNLNRAGRAGHTVWYVYDGSSMVWLGEDWSFSGDYGDLTNRPDLSVYKTKQTAVPDPTASGTTDTFISNASQDANGNMTLSKKTIQSATTTQKGIVELATDAEAVTGTDTECAMTPATNKAAHDARHWFGTRAQFEALGPDYDPQVIYHIEVVDEPCVLHWTTTFAALVTAGSLVSGHFYAALPSGSTDRTQSTNLYLATTPTTYVAIWSAGA